RAERVPREQARESEARLARRAEALSLLLSRERRAPARLRFFLFPAEGKGSRSRKRAGLEPGVPGGRESDPPQREPALEAAVDEQDALEAAERERLHVLGAEREQRERAALPDVAQARAENAMELDDLALLAAFRADTQAVG